MQMWGSHKLIAAKICLLESHNPFKRYPLRWQANNSISINPKLLFAKNNATIRNNIFTLKFRLSLPRIKQ